jgi:hypothetical protein
VPDVRHTVCADYNEITTLVDSPVLGAAPLQTGLHSG